MTEHVLAVQRMQDYISAHLAESITLADLARASLFSPWHSYRLFRTHVGLTPAEYIRRLRLSRSAMRLRAERAPGELLQADAEALRARAFPSALRKYREIALELLDGFSPVPEDSPLKAPSECDKMA